MNEHMIFDQHIKKIRLRLSSLSELISRQLSIISHYPRGHAYLLGGLGVCMLGLLALPSESSNAGPALTTLPVTSKAIDSNTGFESIAISPQPAAAAAQNPMPTLEAVDGDRVEDLNSASASTQSDSLVSSEKDTQPPQWKKHSIASGDSLSSLFSKVGLNDGDLFTLLNSSAEAKVLNRVYPGYQLEFKIPTNGELEQLRVLKNPLEGYLFTRTGETYSVDTIVKTPEIRQTFKVGTISDSLFLAGKREQIPATTIMEMANIFGGVIDFILDPRAGDEFSILYEEKYLDGKFIGHGEILASRFVNQGKVFTAVRYIDDEGEVGYYNPEGESMRKAFLRSPLDVFRISSNFNPSRRHPVLNTIRAHKGTDYAAPTGTPIRATSDGRVTFSGRKGSFGNLVIIKHSGGFETKYAHLNKFGAYKKGARVRQGDVIGYVGSTGSATGPHLHYEFLVNGVHKNPRTIVDKLPKARSVDPDQLENFKSQTAGLVDQFNTLAAQGQKRALLTLAQ
jgi:murein DD-endopeptidase MepM/ murein hydrolase activator NlpD